MILYSPAKLNLYLDVLGKRPDGYHNIRTIFERITLFDKIRITPNTTGKIRLVCDSKDIPADKTNLVYKAAELLKKDFRMRLGVDIEIKKRIPAGAGLGGGSSNAAAALIGLNRHWGLNLTRKTLAGYAAKIGSDVAFFLSNSPFALGTGRGERIKPLDSVRKKLWHIVVVPDVKVSTREIYQGLDRIAAGKKPARVSGSNSEHKISPGLTVNQLLRRAKTLSAEIFFNRLESITFAKYPKVKEIKDILSKLNLKVALMSGSGSAVFGIVDSRKEGLKLAEFFRRFKKLKIFVVATERGSRRRPPEALTG